MKQKITLLFFALLATFSMSAQNIVKGVVNDRNSEGFLQGVSVSLQGTNINQTTGLDGVFVLKNVPNGKQLVIIKKNGYETQSFPVNMSGKEIDLGTIFMYEDEFAEEQDQSIITITDDELNDDASSADNISGLLQSSRDVYLRTAAFEWSPSFYRIRGLDSENGKVLINGIEMNKLYNGRPQWSNWGGANDLTRNQEFSNNLTPSNYTFGGALGSTNINTRASEYRNRGSITYSSSNRSYRHRFMGSYASGVDENGWAYAVLLSRRAGNEGYMDGTLYNSNTIMASVEKIFNDKHSLNFTSIYAQNKRGKSASNTQEVYDIKGIKYNPYWGYQNGKMRNSRIKRIEEPILMLNHYWNISDKTSLNTNVAYQFGEMGNSRLDYNGSRLLNDGTIVGGAPNPDPTYYRNLPSSPLAYSYNRYGYITNSAKAEANDLRSQFQKNGQINWDELYRTNLSNSESTNSKYILYEDRVDDKQLTANTILNTEITDNITVNGKLQYTKLESENFASVLDLLGGKGYLDVDTYSTGIAAQNNTFTPNRIVGMGDKFKYHYTINSEIMNAFLQGQFKFNKIDFYLAGDISRTTHQRDGHYQNGGALNNSYGKSPKLEFTNFSGKAGLTYKITGRHLIDINGGYLTKAPSIRNTFSNSRENNDVVLGLESEKILLGDASYVYRGSLVQAKLTGYYTELKDGTNIQFFYNQDRGTLVQEVMTNIEKRHFGAELGIEAKITSTFKVKGAANIGQYTYNNNPDIYVATEQGIAIPKIKSYLKNYKVASGPQKTYSLGFEYRDPDYWWVSVSGNYFDDAYLGISPLRRTSVFSLDNQGIPYPNYNETTARKLLAQEEFGGYFTLNAVGGKSWKVGNGKYLGFFASVANILNEKYKTGGYEFSRYSNYNQLKQESELETPLFGNKYWYGRDATYFVNVYYRF